MSFKATDRTPTRGGWEHRERAHHASGEERKGSTCGTAAALEGDAQGHMGRSGGTKWKSIP